MHPESGLTKARWTDQDLDAMSWHACQIHALAVTDDEGPSDDLTPEEFLEQDDLDDTAPSGMALRFDLDYIVRRVEPSVPGRSYEFWVAPATLIFGSVTGITGDLRSICLPLEMRNLRRWGPAILAIVLPYHRDATEAHPRRRVGPLLEDRGSAGR